MALFMAAGLPEFASPADGAVSVADAAQRGACSWVVFGPTAPIHKSLLAKLLLARADALVLLPSSSFSFRIWTGPSGAIQAKHDRELGPRDLVLACSGFGGFLDLPDERTQVVCVRLDRPATRPFARRFLRRCNVDNRSHIVVASERHPGRPSMVATPQSSHLWPCRC